MLDTESILYTSLLRCQNSYLLAIYDLAVSDCSFCAQMLSMDKDTCKRIASVERETFEHFCMMNKFWILSPIVIKNRMDWSKKDSNFFNDWVFDLDKNLASNSNNLYINAPECCTSALKNLITAQSSLIFAIGDSSFKNVGFTLAVINLEREILDVLNKNWFNQNKFVLISNLKPVFRLNENIDSKLLVKFDRNCELELENTLFSLR